MNLALSRNCQQLPPDDSLFESIACGLESQGYVVLPAVLPEPLTRGLLDYLANLEAGAFHVARIGRGSRQMRNKFVRRDRIHWISEEHPGGTGWLTWLDQLMQYLNRRLFLGLFSLESHFSLYQHGDFYRKHLDAFKGRSNRVLSLVTYLNRGWEPDQGGELVIYAPESDEELVRVVPGFGTLVLFLSEDFPHEVLPTRRERYGVAAWFRINASNNDHPEPPE
ncbi:MAG: 2OG-Fe(II) oxygenase [Gammaproteobacteria bacterium]|nr:2OG-Fe(II) oxygenase [Pseudomonadales bacterium]MCP5348739.1 2OG-Fe(II) oxygenase [Pseudomonadales bacterium]